MYVMRAYIPPCLHCHCLRSASPTKVPRKQTKRDHGLLGCMLLQKHVIAKQLEGQACAESAQDIANVLVTMVHLSYQPNEPWMHRITCMVSTRRVG